MASPYRLAPDSPSRQLLWELNQLAISTQQAFYAQLDREDEEREVQHRQALAKASERHDRIRHDAEQCRLQIEQQIEADRKRREKEAERQHQQRVERELAARRREETERAKTAEAEEKRAAAVRKAEKDAADKRKSEKERQAVEDAGRRSKEDKAAQSRRKDEAQAAGAKAKQDIASSHKLDPTAKTAIPSKLSQASNRNSELEMEHRRYLEIHRSLKELRKGMDEKVAQIPRLKEKMGNMRRDIRKSVGQIREGKGTNNIPLKAIMETLKKAVTEEQPTVDVPTYLASPPTQISDPKGPALVLYLLNIFAKDIVAQLINEAGVKPQIADALGTVASHIFAVVHFRWNDISLIDILIAKMHAVCPVLYGIYGDERTVQGKQRLGWVRQDGDGPFIPQQSHFERMTGLSAGFAGISLKNYEKAQAKNPYPDYNYWQAMARVANVPPNEITQTHFVVLKGMIEGYEAKILNFFGDAGLAALRHVLRELPNRSPPSVAAKALAGLVDVMRREKKLVL